MASPNTKSITNVGNISEGLLGGALIAKITARAPNGKIRKIKSSDIAQTITSMKSLRTKNGGKEKIEIELDVNRKAKDTIKLVLKLGKVVMSELFNLKNLIHLEKEMQAAASYVNSSRIEAFAEAMYNNDIDNKIEIDVDGITNSLTTKSDVTLKTDKYVVEKISLKAGMKASGRSIGQVGGNTWTSVLRLFHNGINPKTGHKEAGLNLPLNTSKYEADYMKAVGEQPNNESVRKAIVGAYQTAVNLTNSIPKATLSKSVVNFLLFHAVRNDTDVTILMFHLGKHKLLTPLALTEGIKHIKNLKAVVRTDLQWPVYILYDAGQGPVPTTYASKNVIFAIRPKVRNQDSTKASNIAHLVEEGPLFSVLLSEE